MASTINATTNGIVNIGDSVATLALQTGGTTAVAIDTAQIVSLSKSLALLGSTSGSVTLAAPAVSGSTTLTLPATSGTLLQSGTAVTVAQGGTGLTTGTSGGVPYFSSASAISSSAALTQYGVVYGGGAGAAQVATAAGTTGQFLGANTGAAPTWQTPSGGSAATTTTLGTIYGSTTLTSSAPYYNTCLGWSAGLNLGTGGSENVYIGDFAGQAKTGGDSCIYIGSGSQGSSTTSSYEIVLNASGTSAVGKGNGTGFIRAGFTIGGIYQANNSASWSTTSDRRLKKNIVDNNVGLDAIKSIQVRNFQYRLPEEVDPELKPTDAIEKSGVQLGVIAQELQSVLPDCVKQESTGVLSVDPDNLTWYTINAIKQLSAALDAANARIAALEAK